MRKNRKILFMLFTLFVSFIMIDNVNAMDQTASVYIKRSEVGTSKQIKDVRWDGSMTFKGWSNTSPANANTRNAWCTTFGHPSDAGFVSGLYNTSNCGTWFSGKDLSLNTAGQIVDYLSVRYKDASDKDRKYIYTVLTLNSFFAKRGVDGAIDFTKERKDHGANATLRALIDEFIQIGKSELERVYANRMDPPTVTVGSNTMHKIGDYYVSDLVRINPGSVLYTSFPNTNTKVSAVTNSVVAAASNPTGTVWYCSDARGTANCTTTPPSGSFTGYIKITGANEGTFQFTVSSNATMTYNVGVIVCYGSKPRTHQAMMITRTVGKSLPGSTVLRLNVPKDVELRIAKVDENGNAIGGAHFSVKAKDNNNVETPITLESTDGGKTFVSTNLQTGFTLKGKTLTFVEDTVPSGYEKLEIKDFKVPDVDGTFCSDSTDSNSSPVQGACNVEKACPVTETTIEQTCTAENADDCTDESNNWEDVEGSGGSNTSNVKTSNECSTLAVESEYKYDESDHKKRTKRTVVPGSAICLKGNDTVDCNRYYETTINGNSVFLVIPNNKNKVTFSKKAATGEDEVEGARLKVCKLSDYNGSNGVNDKCTVAKTVANVDLEWESASIPKVFEGIPQGTYVIIETLPPNGFLPLSTVTQFTVDKNNKISTGSTTSSDNVVVIHNSYNEVTISKTDIVTTKELPGAKLAICLAGLKKDMVTQKEESSSDTNSTNDESSTSGETSTSSESSPNVEENKDENNSSDSTNPSDYAPVIGYNGDCIPATLKDGSGQAVWVSGNTPHKIRGLGEGTYFLVETTAPNGYATSESILFRMNVNGELTDIKGNSLKDNKIVMKDAPLKQVKTGKTGLVIAIVGTFAAAGAAIYFFAFHNKAVATVSGSQVVEKIRKRRIHK